MNYTRRDFLKSLSATILVAGGARANALPLSGLRLFADVVVYGGTSAGVIAAVQAARMGRDVVLLEPTHSVGGMTASGLGATDISSPTYCSGLAREFYNRVYTFYGQPDAWKFENHDNYVALHPIIKASPTNTPIWHRFEPHAASKVFADMLHEANVRVVTGERLDLKRGVAKIGSQIVSLTMESGTVITGAMFIDATYEGDLMAKAGVRYTVGRESNDMYDETLNGVRPGAGLNIDPFLRPGDPASGLLPGVQNMPPGVPGEADDRVQAYIFRLCLTDLQENSVPFPKPDSYDPAAYESIARVFSDLRGPRLASIKSDAPPASVYNKCEFASFTALPNLKVDSNTGPGPYNADLVGLSYAWPEADYAAREELWRQHANFTKGLMWFAANDPRVPEPVRLQMRQWGLAADEFTDTENWPPQLYVREARRMVSDYVMTQHHPERRDTAWDGVTVASYRLDCHRVSYYRGTDGEIETEGGIFVPSNPFAISYRSIRPHARDCENLLVTCCVSASHVAYGSIRMEPVYMMLGQAAATAACLALDESVTVQEVSYDDLRPRLEKDGLIIAPLPEDSGPMA